MYNVQIIHFNIKTCLNITIEKGVDGWQIRIIRILKYSSGFIGTFSMH